MMSRTEKILWLPLILDIAFSIYCGIKVSSSPSFFVGVLFYICMALSMFVSIILAEAVWCARKERLLKTYKNSLISIKDNRKLLMEEKDRLTVFLTRTWFNKKLFKAKIAIVNDLLAGTIKQ